MGSSSTHITLRAGGAWTKCRILGPLRERGPERQGGGEVAARATAAAELPGQTIALVVLLLGTAHIEKKPLPLSSM
eukprot:1162077-Pelagomonas_calceolata.AAC.10